MLVLSVSVYTGVSKTECAKVWVCITHHVSAKVNTEDSNGAQRHVFTLYSYFTKNDLHLITSLINLCNHMYNNTVDPSLTP